MRALLLASMLVVAACGGDDDGLSIADLDCTPTMLVANQLTAVSCDFTYTDGDLVVDNIHAELVHPSGAVDMVDIPFDNADMETTGPGFFNANLMPDGVGTATLRLSMTGGGATSNVTTFAFTCVSP